MQSFLVQRIKFRSINQITKYLGFKSHFFLASTKLFSPEYNKNFKADLIMKNYFNKRNQMSVGQLIQLVNKLKSVRVTTSFFNDQRWIHLNVLIQKNLSEINIQQQFQILSTFTKLRFFSQLFQTIHKNLTQKIETLVLNEKALLLYYMAKSSKVNIQNVKKISNALIAQLNNQQMKIKFGLNWHDNSQRSIKTSEKEQNQDQIEQSLFQNEIILGDSKEKLQIACQNLVLCLWSLHKLRIHDHLLTDCILKKHLKPNISKMPASIFPLLLSTLWLHRFQNKRIYETITHQLMTREKQLIRMDRDNIKITCCMLCKPQIQAIQKESIISPENIKTQKEQKMKNLSQARQKLVLWLMQTLLIKHENSQQHLYGSNAFQILKNASQAKIIDYEIYSKYLTLICSDLQKIQTKQIIYLLALIQKMRMHINFRKSQQIRQRQQFCGNQHEILSRVLLKDIMGFLNKVKENHNARIMLRKMILTDYLKVPKGIKKKIWFQQKEYRKNQNNNFSQNKSQFKEKKSQQIIRKNSPKNKNKKIAKNTKEAQINQQ